MTDRIVLRVRDLWAAKRQLVVEQWIQGQINRRVDYAVRERLEPYRRDFTALQRAVQNIERHVQAVEENQTRLGMRMTSIEQTEQDRWDEAGRVAGLVLAEVASIRDQLTAALRDQSEVVDAAVAASRQEEAQRDIERLDSLTARLREALPVEVPEVPTPDPGEPAVDPASGQSSDDVVADSGSDAGDGSSEG